MEKSYNLHKKYKNLSKLESQLLNKLEEFVVFSPSMARKLIGWKRARASNVIVSLKRKGVVTAIQKDRLVLTEKIPGNLFAIATRVVVPSYVSFWSAASYYGMTEQQVNAVQLVSTKQHPKMKIGTHPVETTTCNPSKFFGYSGVQNFSLAEKEKLILEMLSRPELSGGLEEVKKCISSVWPGVDQKKVFQYLKKFGQKSCAARLGYLLEELRLKSTLVPELLRYLPKGFVRLNPRKKPVAKYSKKWRVIIND